MRTAVIVALLSLIGVSACGGTDRGQVKSAEADPWSSYKGTYAEPAPIPAHEGDTKTSAPADVATAAPSAPAKKSSKATIHGESISSVGLEALADASKSASKGKILSTKYVVGPQYEQMKIRLKGAAIQMIRPAANPAPDGPNVRSPRARSDEVKKTESSWYDEEADVVVVVSARKRAGAEKLLGTILKH